MAAVERRMPQRVKRKRVLMDDEEGFEVCCPLRMRQPAHFQAPASLQGSCKLCPGDDYIVGVEALGPCCAAL